MREANKVTLDHDTKDIPGTPDLAATILSKIEACDIFLADVSIVSNAASGRRFSNPNVLIELGYALHALGSDKVLLIMDIAAGTPEELPFDLRHKRNPITFCSTHEKMDEHRIQLIDTLKSALKPYRQISTDTVDLALSAAPSILEIEGVLMACDSKDDWSETDFGLTTMKYYNHNVALRLQINYTDKGTHNNDFKEVWANNFPDSKATSHWCDLYFHNTLLRRFLLVSVDGGRALLPLPKLPNLEVDPLKFKIAQIFDNTDSLNTYMWRSGLSVGIGKNNDEV